MRKQLWAFVGVLVMAMLLLVACGGNDSSDDTALASGEYGAVTGGAVSESFSRDADGSAPNGAPSDAVTSPGSEPAPGNTGDSETFGGKGADGGLTPLALQQVGDGRVIIFTSSMVVEVEDVPGATQRAQAAIAGLGGLLFGQNTTTEPYAYTTLTFKVRPEDFQEALRRLEELGKLESQQISTDDVTERVVDLQSRITTSEASVERLRAFLSNATDLEGVAQIEAQLLIRETDLEVLRGQLRTIQEQASLATIYLTLTEPQPDEPEASVDLVQTAYLDHDRGAHCPGDDELKVDEGEAMTVCFSIENTGNLALTEIEIRDVGLDLDEDDFVVLEGSLEVLEPGDTLMGYFETDAELRHYADPRFSAVPVDEDGDPVRVGIEIDGDLVSFDIVEDTSVPSFTDGLSGSIDAVISLGQLAILAVGVAIPFLWVPLLVVALVWFIRRRTTPSRTLASPVATTATAAAPTNDVESDN